MPTVKPRDGRQPRCKVCAAAQRRASYLKNRDKALAQMRAYREQNADAILVAKQRWAHENREHTRAYFKKWREEHPGYGAPHSSARRARLAGAVGSHSNADWLRMCRVWDMRCAYCGTSGVKLTRDHIVPLSRGGSDFIGNILPACLSCNSGKCDRTIIEWRASGWRKTGAATAARAIPRQSVVLAV